MFTTRTHIIAKRNWKHFLADETGSDTLEFALSSILVLTVVFGIMDCSRAVYIDHYLALAAQNGARYAMVRGASWSSGCFSSSSSNCNASSTNITDYVSGTATAGIMPANMTVNTSWPGTNASGSSCTTSSVNNLQGCVVNVQVSYAFEFVLPFLPKNMLTMSSASAATILQ